jgi:multicomponent Na+:H+ antiporter subunit A
MMLPLLLGILFALAAVTMPLARVMGRQVGYVIAAVLTVAAVALGIRGPAVLAGDPLTSSTPWIPGSGISVSLTMDGLGLLFALIVLGIGAVVMAYAARYFPRSGNDGRVFALLTFFAGSMLGLVLADDVVLLFVFWELTSVSSFFLIGGKGEGRSGATRAFVVTALGGLALMAGLLLLAVDAGTFRLSEILATEGLGASALAPAIIVLLLLGAFTKSAQFPFHFWLPGAMVAPTPVSTYLHAATMVKAGIYLLFRMTPLYGGVPLWQVTLVLVGLGTAVLGAVIAVSRTDLKALLAYSTISQLGLITAVVGVGTPLAIAAAALHTLAHALFKATLFMTVGIVDHEAGSRDLRVLSGLRRRLPGVALAGGLAALSMAGLPPLVGFVSKEEAFAAFLEAPGPAWLSPTAATLAVIASVLTFAYSARYYWGTFEGAETSAAHRAPGWFVAPTLLTAVAGLVVGLRVPLLDPLVNGVAAGITGQSAELGLGLWHGFGLPLLMSAVVVGAGLTAFAGRVWLERTQLRFALPLDGALAFDRLYHGTLALGKWVGRPAASDVPAHYLLPMLGALLLLGGAAALTGVDGGDSPAPSFTADWVLVALLAASILGVVQARSRLAAVATLGLSGFLVAGWFVLLGAPDLAATQLLVETLTIMLVVLVFRRLPAGFFAERPPRRIGAAVVAGCVGVSAGVATYGLTGRRGLSETGAWYLAEAEGLTGGANVVNTILVDFRALDTLGEITVLGAAALGIFALARLAAGGPASRSVDDIAPPPEPARPADGAKGTPP